MDEIVIVSSHNLGTATIENVINEHELIMECTVVGFPHDLKVNAFYAYVMVYDNVESSEDLE
ncbi:MAG: hypothetical protein WBL21_02745 [Salinimicrobium sp.]